MKAPALLAAALWMIQCVSAQTASDPVAQTPSSASPPTSEPLLTLSPTEPGSAAASSPAFAAPRLTSNDRHIKAPLFLFSSELGESTIGVPNGTSTIGSPGVPTDGSLGLSTTGIGGVGTSEIGTESGSDAVSQPPAEIITSVPSLITNIVPNGGILTSNWFGEPILFFPTQPLAPPPGSREAFDASPW